jgi:predicted amidophosphoribosyltransferase
VVSEPKPKIPRDLFVVDEAVRSEYHYIEAGDTCFYVWERMSNLWSSGQRPDYTQYPVNSLISNLQISPTRKTSQPQRHYWKERAIKYTAEALAALLPEEWRNAVTFAPIPPSRVVDEPEYDERLLTVLKAIRPKLADVRPLVVLKSDCGVDSKQKGLTPADRAVHYVVDEKLVDPEPEIVMLFDDVLTTGCHYKAIEQVLKVRFPNATVFGLFLARAVRPQNDSTFDLFSD